MALAMCCFTNCSKEDDFTSSNGSSSGGSTTFVPECEEEDYGTLRINNENDDPYEIRLDGEYIGRITGNAVKNFLEVPSGRYNLEATQESGYILYPTVYDGFFDIDQCQTTALRLDE